MKKLLSLILCLCLVGGLNSNICIHASESNAVANTNPIFLDEQDKSNEAYNRLLAAFAEGNNLTRIDESFPDYYAGAYINSDDGHLVVLYSRANASELLYMSDVCQNCAVEFQEVDYSLNELLEIRDSIIIAGNSLMIDKPHNTSLEGPNTKSVVLATSIRENENTIYVGLSDFDEKCIRELSNEFYHVYSGSLKPTNNDKSLGNNMILSLENDLPVKFYLEKAISFSNEASMYPGNRIEYSLGFLQGSVYGSAGYYGSVTYGGNTHLGFFTAGHNLQPNPTAVVKNGNGDNIGQALVYTVTDLVDAGFVETTGYACSFYNFVDGIQLTTGITVIPAIGSTIYKVGQTTGKTWGTVISNLNSGPGYQDQVEATYSSSTGDSGGLVYTLSSTQTKVVGLHRGTYGSYRYATKASYIGWNATVQ